MIGSKYAPQTWNDVKVSFVLPNALGIQADVQMGSTQNVDTKIVNDSLFRGIKLIASNTTFGDTVSVKIVDIDGVYYPAGAVLSSPVLNFNIVSDQQLQANYESVAPFKIPGGLYVRIIYTSTGGLVGSIKLGANLLLVTILQ